MSKHSAPPECNANLLRPGQIFEDLRRTSATMMKIQHTNILALETARHELATARELWDACHFANMPPVRLMWEYFKRDKYSANSPDGRHLLIGMLTTLPDNKIVEDIHAPLRLASKGNNNDRLSAPTIQDVINHSNVMEPRNINHSVSVSKEEFTE